MRQTKAMQRYTGFLAALTLIALTVVDIGRAQADPPPWAPAWGWRAKHGHGDDDHYKYYRSGTELNCAGRIVGGTLGAVGGGVLGGSVVEGDWHDAAVIGGAILGAVIGGVIGQEIDEADGDCAGRALVGAPIGHKFAWRNDYRSIDYIFVPVRDFHRDGLLCREFSVKAMKHGKSHKGLGSACRGIDGVWRILG